MSEIAAKIREELKKNGYNCRQVSVSGRIAGYDESIHVTVRDDAVSERKIAGIVEKYKSISYDEYCGEILAGGNTYIRVERKWKNGYAPNMPNGFAEFLQKALSVETGHIVNWSHGNLSWHLNKYEEDAFDVWLGDNHIGTIHSCWNTFEKFVQEAWNLFYEYSIG